MAYFRGCSGYGKAMEPVQLGIISHQWGLRRQPVSDRGEPSECVTGLACDCGVAPVRSAAYCRFSIGGRTKLIPPQLRCTAT
jgi:hypothetical protein